ncbi:MAG: AEC family transporter [Armatimonadota bacterium]|nr:AEC family transporter [Armatimonadota bacterium]
MPLFTAIFTALAPPFLLIVLGWALKRARVLHPAHVPILNGLVINITLPALVLLGLLRAPALSPRLAVLPLAFFGAEIVTLGIAYGIGRVMRLPVGLQGAILMVGVFGNTGFIGYPLTLALLPREFPTTILLDQFGMTLPMYFGAALLGAQFGGSKGSGGGGRRTAILRFLRSPIFLSALLGLGLRLVPIPPALTAVPFLRETGGIVGHCLEYLGQGTTPVVLLALGVALRPGAAGGRVGPMALACGCKLLVCPLLMWGLCHALGVRGEALMDSVLIAAMPAAVMSSVLSAQNDMEGDFAVGVVFVSTVLSAVTLPLLLTVLR